MVPPDPRALHASRLLKRVCQHASSALLAAVPDKLGDLRKARPKRPYTPKERYVGRVLQATGELLNVCDQMAYSVALLSGYKRRVVGETVMTRFDYIRFQVENFTIRTGMLCDRALQLVNVVADLGVPPRECKYPVIAKNGHVERTAAGAALAALQKAVQNTQSERNAISHRESFQDDGLYEVELSSVLQKSSGAGADEIVGLASKLAKPKADEYIKTKGAELNKISKAVYDATLKLLDSLVDPYQERLDGFA